MISTIEIRKSKQLIVLAIFMINLTVFSQNKQPWMQNDYAVFEFGRLTKANSYFVINLTSNKMLSEFGQLSKEEILEMLDNEKTDYFTNFTLFSLFQFQYLQVLSL